MGKTLARSNIYLTIIPAGEKYQGAILAQDLVTYSREDFIRYDGADAEDNFDRVIQSSGTFDSLPSQDKTDITSIMQGEVTKANTEHKTGK